MFKEEQRRYAALGGDYFWFAGKRHLTWDLCAPYIPTDNKDLKILDIGCGPGYAFTELMRWGKVYGLDPSPDAFAAESLGTDQKQRLVVGSAEDLPFDQDSFDMTVAFEIFEHLDGDQKAIDECYRILKPGGKLLMTVPAFQSLWGHHDELYFHKRRYRRKEILERLEKAGFKVERLTYCHFVFFLPLWIMRTLKKVILRGKKQDDFVHPANWLNSLLTWVVRHESVLLKRINMPWGVSLIGIASKPSL